jgi:hypothetical protein
VVQTYPPSRGHRSNPSNTEVICMPTFARSTIASVFCEHDLVFGKQGGRFLRSRLGDLTLIRSLTGGSRALVARTDRLIAHSRSDAFVLALGLSTVAARPSILCGKINSCTEVCSAWL